MKPTVGRIVHYVSHGTPVQAYGSQAYVKQCRAAVVSEVEYDGNEPQIGVVVLNPTGLFFHPIDRTRGYPGGLQYCPGGIYEETGACNCGTYHEPGFMPGSWHWPERTDDPAPPALPPDVATTAPDFPGGADHPPASGG